VDGVEGAQVRGNPTGQFRVRVFGLHTLQDLVSRPAGFGVEVEKIGIETEVVALARLVQHDRVFGHPEHRRVHKFLGFTQPVLAATGETQRIGGFDIDRAGQVENRVHQMLVRQFAAGH
jgi:hypothetical protein